MKPLGFLSSARSRPSAVESLSSSEREEALIATGSNAVGIVQGFSTRGFSGLDNVSPVSARVSRP